MGRMSKATELSKCEEQVLSVIWSAEEKLALNEIRDRVNTRYGHEWKPQTVSTFLVRMVKKGILNAERSGRYILYTPNISQEEYQGVTIRNMVNMLFEGDLGALKARIQEMEEKKGDKL